RQRVALGRAIVRNPKLFLMDEPLSNLDAKLRVSMRMEIIKLHQNLGTTFIYVTHDQAEAMTMADRIVVMRDGIIQQIDTPERIYSMPANTFVASFIGSPQINFIRGKIEENALGVLEFHTSRFKLPVHGSNATALRKHSQVNKQVVLGIRPENISLEALFSEAVISGSYQFTELMGADRYLYLDIGQDNLLIARVSPSVHFEKNEAVRLGIDTLKVLFFHRETGERFS
ncbi:ABC transporter ATP-binding protein, partial [Paenibacillus sepulcri]|nr:ABC transporter ATP-binding protein [Paenibacillus sepulcri]